MLPSMSSLGVSLRSIYCSALALSSLAILPVSGVHAQNLSVNRETSPVVEILTSSSPGSGVIVGRKNNTFTVFTAAHVLTETSMQELEIILPNNQSVVPISVNKPFQDIDLAVLTFSYSQSLPIASILSSDSALEEVTQGSLLSIDVVGFAITSDEVRESPLRASSGTILSTLSANKDGYNLLYNATTNVGMSGGGVFAQIPWDITIEPIPNAKGGFTYSYRNSMQAATSRPAHQFLSKQQLRSSGQIYTNQMKPGVRYVYNQCIQNPDYRPSYLSSSSMNYINNLYNNTLANMPNQAYKEAMTPAFCTQFANIAAPKCLPASNQRYRGANSRVIVGIHGRAEKYIYGGRSGSSLAISTQIEPVRGWIKKHQNQYGFLPAYSFARYACDLQT